jgi:hypothetical protein
VNGAFDQPWWRRTWGKVYLALLGCATAVVVVLAVIPVPRGEDGRGMAVEKMLVITWTVVGLDVLLVIGIFVAIHRRTFWRPAGRDLDVIVSIVLSFVTSTAVIVFLFVACSAVIRR